MQTGIYDTPQANARVQQGKGVRGNCAMQSVAGAASAQAVPMPRGDNGAGMATIT
jgi:hypothetical protein